MVDKVQTDEMKTTGELPVASPAPGAPGAAGAAGAAVPGTPPKRSPGHRGADMRDTMAEMAARAQEISMEAGSKIAGAMKDVINAAAGLTGFAIESARDLVQYMVRRGQMTQDEADKILREAEEAAKSKKPVASAYPQVKATPVASPAVAAHHPAIVSRPGPVPAPAPAAAPRPAPAVKKAAAPAPAAKSASRPAPKPAAKAPAKAASKPATRAAAKSPAKSASKSSSKAAAKPALKKPAAKRK